MLALLNWVWGVVSILGILLLPLATRENTPLVLLESVFLLTVGFLNLLCGYGLWTLKSYGRTLQRVFSWIGLFVFPLGTAISALILLYLYQRRIKMLFAGDALKQLNDDQEPKYSGPKVR